MGGRVDAVAKKKAEEEANTRSMTGRQCNGRSGKAGGGAILVYFRGGKKKPK